MFHVKQSFSCSIILPKLIVIILFYIDCAVELYPQEDEEDRKKGQNNKDNRLLVYLYPNNRSQCLINTM